MRTAVVVMGSQRRCRGVCALGASGAAGGGVGMLGGGGGVAGSDVVGWASAGNDCCALVGVEAPLWWSECGVVFSGVVIMSSLCHYKKTPVD